MAWNFALNSTSLPGLRSGWYLSANDELSDWNPSMCGAVKYQAF